MRAFSDFQIASTSKKHGKLMPWSATIFEKKSKFFIKRAVFPVKSKLQKLFWPQSYGINLEKVNSVILEQIRIIEFCPFDH